MTAVRVVVAGHVPPERALALDEAIVRARPTGPVLLTWRTDPAVVVGRFQRADWEVDAAACADAGVRVWRRFTGGGAVCLDAGTLCLALALPPGDPRAAAPIPDMYQPLLSGVVAVLARCGVEAVHDERCVRVGGRKVTGIAAHRSAAATMVHGTVLISADLDRLRAVLAGSRAGPLEGLPKPAPSRPDHVANTDAEAIEHHLAAAFGGRPGELTAEEAARADELAVTRYTSRAWHAGPWAAVTPPAVLEVLGGVRS